MQGSEVELVFVPCSMFLVQYAGLGFVWLLRVVGLFSLVVNTFMKDLWQFMFICGSKK